MIQGYFLSIIYLVMSSFLILLDYYRQRLVFMLRLRALLEENRTFLNIWLITGGIIGLMLLFFPVSPGPTIIGDLLPSFFVLFSSVYFRISLSGRNNDRTRFYYEEKSRYRKGLGFTLLAIATLHFILPSFVLL